MQIYHDKFFIDPIETLIAFSNKEFVEAFDKLENYRNQDLYLLGYIRYDARKIFAKEEIISKLPLLYFEVYEDAFDYIPYTNENNVNIYIQPEISFAQYEKAIKTIKNHILKGDTYEVNYTYPTKVYANTNSYSLYNYLLEKQPTKYNTFITNKYEDLLSFSPELFFSIEGNKITTKPMKGTIKRGQTKEEDENKFEFLKNDEKNRSENLMIVDLIRNDLSKISKTGTVKATKLFEVETHETLHQMTSEISSELNDDITLYDIFDALFPCGSITGAPKISTMEIINNIEPIPRDIYCGAIGLISKNKCEFSVPIRILQHNKLENENHYTYHSGGAIVWDSDIKEEWEETITKQKILRTSKQFSLLDTLLINNGEIPFIDLHKKRMKKSAEEFGIEFDESNYVFDCKNDAIVRVLLKQSGEIDIEYNEINEILSNKIIVASSRMDVNNKFLYHKTTFRPWYSYSLKNYFDVIFFNENEELTEGSRSNIVLEIDGKCYTPPVECGLLNGVYRQYLINNNKLIEKILYKNDLENADKIYCVNSVRGMVEVELIKGIEI